MHTGIDSPPDPHTRILITGGNGFVGEWVVRALLGRGFTNLVCIARSAGGVLGEIAKAHPEATLDIVIGNLLSDVTCAEAVRGAEIVYHLAAGRGSTFPACVLNSVVTTRHLLDAVVREGTVRRFVNVSSMSVYSNAAIPRGGVLRENSPIDDEIAQRHDPYAYAKALQDDLVAKYADEHGLQYVTVRPGFVIGPGKPNIPGRVGNAAFGVFLNIAPRNRMPFTYVENCADAIVAAGLVPGIERETVVVVDDDLPTSAAYLRRYKKKVGWFPTVPTPYKLYYAFTAALERYSHLSQGQIPRTFNRRSTRTYYKGNSYSNERAKELLGWRPRVGMNDALDRCFQFIRSTKGAS